MSNNDLKRPVDWLGAAANDAITPEAAARAAFEEQMALRLNSNISDALSGDHVSQATTVEDRNLKNRGIGHWLRSLLNKYWAVVFGLVLFEWWRGLLFSTSTTLGWDGPADNGWWVGDRIFAVISILSNTHLLAVVLIALILRELHGARLATR